MRRGGSGPGMAGAVAVTGGGLTGAGASVLAAAIDAVRLGAASSTNAGAGAETGAGLAGAGASGLPVPLVPVRVGARVLDRRLGPEAVVDEDARGKCCEERYGRDERRFHASWSDHVVDPAERVLTMCFTQIEMDDHSKKRFDS
jgi:hypothetical protein